jgi:hypothetical protein
VAGVWVKVGSAGGGALPGGSPTQLQFNNTGSFGGVNQTSSNIANCDGSGDPCDIYFTQTNTFTGFMGGTNTAAPMGNNWNCANENDGGVYCNATDTTDTTTFAFAPGSGNSGMITTHSAKQTGFNINSGSRAMELGRLNFSADYTTSPTSMSFALGAGWGSTAAAGTIGGSDNAFIFTITTGGTGIAANPTITYTYADGDFDTGGASTPIYVCSQTGGNDIRSDIDNTPAQTTLAMTWHGTPTTGKTYTFSCIGFQRS